MKRALITGIRGQDGAYLARLLLSKGYEVWGADRRSGESSNWRLRKLGVHHDVRIVYMDLLEYSNVLRTIQTIQPDEIYNLAAQSFVAASFEQPIVTSHVNALGVLHVLEAIRATNPRIKFYQASTSEMFGKARETPQNELTPLHPRSPYGVSKVFGHGITVNYREAYGLFACSGILFNHESPLRGEEFVTRKIAMAVARHEPLVLGNLDAGRDWGFAGEYVEGMWRMLQHPTPDDYVLATGEMHSVREFVEHAFEALGIQVQWDGSGLQERGLDLSGKVLVQVSPEFYRPAEVDRLVGDASKARTVLGWTPRVTFQELVKMMVAAP